MAVRTDGAWSRFLRWLREGSEPLDEAMQADLGRGREDLARAGILNPPEAEEPAPAEAPEPPAPSPRRRKLASRLYGALAALLCAGIIAVLLEVAGYLPPFGQAANPVHNEVSRRYIEQGQTETGAVNIVAGMILDYRAFDTLGESNVLFIAACSVLLLLRVSDARERSDRVFQLETEADDRMFEPKNDMILQHSAKILVPLILLYGMYVVMNGHLSPGGGFSGGAVMGAGLILHLTAYGFRRSERFFTIRTFRVCTVLALSFYALSKTYSFYTGANHLPSFITPGTPGMLFSAGLIPYLNLAVGLVVASTMYAFYALFRKGDL